MWPRSTIRIVIPLALAFLARALPALSQDDGKPGAEETAIRAVDEVFVRAYNQGDSKALAALFTEDAEVVEADGSRFQGRSLVEQSFADTFAADKGVKIAFDVAAIRILTPDAAKEEGRSLATPAKGAPVSRLYTVLYVKRDGRWLISSVREESDPLTRPHDRLKDLEWMIGEWVEERSDSVVRLICRWSDDKNFLLRSVTVKHEGKAVLTISQRIGWDPLARQIRSWEFDSEGGFGEGRWSRDGERWVVKHSDVQPGGTTSSATNVMTREGADMIKWTSTDRVVGDQSDPGEESYVLVRVPPAPGLKSTAGAESSPSPKNTRGPR